MKQTSSSSELQTDSLYHSVKGLFTWFAALLFAFLLVVSFALLFVFSVIAFSFFWSYEQPKPNNGAPDSKFLLRRAWGKKEFGEHWGHVNKWIAKSELISESIGEIQDVAPVGKPNRLRGPFDPSADMNLELVGSKGTGVLSLNGFCLNWRRSGKVIYRFNEGTFKTTGGRTQVICQNGVGYLEKLSLDHLYNELIDYPADEDPDVFLRKWKLFQQTIATTFPPSHSTSTFTAVSDKGEEIVFARSKPPLLKGLEKIYRVPLLLKAAELFDHWELKEGAVPVFCAAAKLCLDEAWRELCRDSTDCKLVADRLNIALRALRKANELQPENEDVLKLARSRVSYNQRLKSGGFTMSQKNYQSIFFEAASREANSMPFLKSELGEFDICAESSRVNGLSLNKNNRYRASVYLEVDGKLEDGTVVFSYHESKKLPPVDLFADNPRPPDYPLSFWSPLWKSKSGEEVKISNKTGKRFKSKAKTKARSGT